MEDEKLTQRGLTGVVAAAALVAAVSAGCATVAPIGPGLLHEPNEREVRLWAASEEASTQWQSGGAMHRDDGLREYVESVLERVLEHDSEGYAPLVPRVFIVDNPKVNAFAYPHGHIFVHTGMLARLRNEAQLAMLLGHEITHATHRHAYQEREDATARTDILAFASILSAVGGGDIASAIGNLGQIVTVAAISGYSREKEAEADRIGLTLIARAGYTPAEGAKMFQRMLDATDTKSRHWSPFYATHPKMKDRVKTCKRLVGELPPEVVAGAQEIGQDRYLARASYLIYGEARRHIAQGRYDLALQTLDFLRENKAESANAAALRGELYEARAARGDRSRAEQAYRDALEIDTSYAPAHKGLGFLLLRENETQEATRHLRRYLELVPDANDADLVRQYIDRSAGKTAAKTVGNDGASSP